MKSFGQLVAIKTLHEEKAERTVRTQLRVLGEAVTERDTAERRLTDFRDYASEQERKIYKGLCERVVRLRDIEDVHGQVQSLRARETAHREDVKAAEARRVKEEQKLDSDRKVHNQALITREKFVELGDVFAQEARKEAEQKEEAEIEEVAETRRPAHSGEEQ